MNKESTESNVDQEGAPKDELSKTKASSIAKQKKSISIQESQIGAVDNNAVEEPKKTEDDKRDSGASGSVRSLSGAKSQVLFETGGEGRQSVRLE